MQDPKDTIHKTSEHAVTETPKPITKAIDEGKLNPPPTVVPTPLDQEHKEPKKKSA
jgi:hypothetical protein